MAPGTGEASLSRRPQGALPGSDGTLFRVASSCAERIELCLFDGHGRALETRDLLPEGEGDWSIFCPGIGAGHRYGYRVHGPWAPDQGLRCNPAKLLLDPYARRITGEFHWSAAVFDYDTAAVRNPANPHWRISELDSAPYVPRSVVGDELPPLDRERQRRWSELVIYETNVRGFSMRHPGLSAQERGRLAGLANGQIVEYLKALGVNCIELQPVQAWLDEEHLARAGLRNYWGYNPIGFFAPAPRLAGEDPVQEFRAMVSCLHDAGMEVLLDVAYNHTAEGDGLGPSLCFRGLDNLAWYRVEPGDPAVYINDTGCGNTLNADQPRCAALVLDSLVYWHTVMGVDGFRFDLAPVLGRRADGFDPAHPLLTSIGKAPALRTTRLIAEPWDPGPGGYQLGHFPPRWAEWNDQFRDTQRRFWRGDDHLLRPLADAFRGSPERFAKAARPPTASVNFITAHDGFTLTDLVSFTTRHNEANGEENRDGHQHNFSVNHGEEGATDNAVIRALRHRHRRNLLGSLLLARGTPMLLAGDERGHSQDGNNNAYAMDNETCWIDWAESPDDDLAAEVKTLLALRRKLPALRAPVYGETGHGTPWAMQWLRPDTQPMSDAEWHDGKAMQALLCDEAGQPSVCIVINGHDHEVEFICPTGRLPSQGSAQNRQGADETAAFDPVWALCWSADGQAPGPVAVPWRAAAWSIAVLEML